jgi:ubiquitin-associated SH3 domain-containing protein
LSNLSSLVNRDSSSNLLKSESKLFTFKPNPFHSEIEYMQEKFRANPQKSLQISNLLRFFIARHGERIDLTFGVQWVEKSFDQNGKYKRINLNMPNDLPFRNTRKEFIGDSPLTEVGKFQAKLTGEALGNEGYKMHFCYSSPSLRCIQTAHKILKGYF